MANICKKFHIDRYIHTFYYFGGYIQLLHIITRLYFYVFLFQQFRNSIQITKGKKMNGFKLCLFIKYRQNILKYSHLRKLVLFGGGVKPQV